MRSLKKRGPHVLDDLNDLLFSLHPYIKLSSVIMRSLNRLKHFALCVLVGVQIKYNIIQYNKNICIAHSGRLLSEAPLIKRNSHK